MYLIVLSTIRNIHRRSSHIHNQFVRFQFRCFFEKNWKAETYLHAELKFKCPSAILTFYWHGHGCLKFCWICYSMRWFPCPRSANACANGLQDCWYSLAAMQLFQINSDHSKSNYYYYPAAPALAPIRLEGPVLWCKTQVVFFAKINPLL